LGRKGWGCSLGLRPGGILHRRPGGRGGEAEQKRTSCFRASENMFLAVGVE